MPPAADDASWMTPPTVKGGVGMFVDVRFNVFKVAKVDTVEGSAEIYVQIMMYWTDQRLEGWGEGEELPARLWTPRFEWNNALGTPEHEFMEPSLESDAGRLKLTQKIRGDVNNPMKLESFPFDIDSIALEFATGPYFRLADGSKECTVAKGKQCVLLCMTRLPCTVPPQY